MEFVETRREMPIPRGWSARTRCRPDEAGRFDKMMEEFGKLNDRVSKAAARRGGYFDARCNRRRMKEGRG